MTHCYELQFIKQLIIVNFKFTATSMMMLPVVFLFTVVHCFSFSSSVIFCDAERFSAYSNIPFSLSSCSGYLLLVLNNELPRHCESMGGSLVYRRGALSLIHVPQSNILLLWRWKHCTRLLGRLLCKESLSKRALKSGDKTPLHYLPLKMYIPARELDRK